MAKEKKRDWVVRVKATSTREVYCENCTEDEARNNTWDHAVGDEVEIECTDYKVTSVEPNE